MFAHKKAGIALCTLFPRCCLAQLLARSGILFPLTFFSVLPRLVLSSLRERCLDLLREYHFDSDHPRSKPRVEGASNFRETLCIHVCQSVPHMDDESGELWCDLPLIGKRHQNPMHNFRDGARNVVNSPQRARLQSTASRRGGCQRRYPQPARGHGYLSAAHRRFHQSNVS